MASRSMTKPKKNDLPPERPPIKAMAGISIITRPDIGAVEVIVAIYPPGHRSTGRRPEIAAVLVANHLDVFGKRIRLSQLKMADKRQGLSPRAHQQPERCNRS